MPKRGSSTSAIMAAVPRKKQKNIEPTNGHDEEEQDENISSNQSIYSSQLFKKSPDVNTHFHLNGKLTIDCSSSYIKMLVLFFELV
jgi:hypothetical protein